MAFTFVRNMISPMSPIAPPKDVQKYQIDTDTVKAGNALYFAGNKVKNALDDSEVVCAIALEAGGNDDWIRVQFVTPGSVFKCPINGTAADVELGKTYQLNDSEELDETAEHGPLSPIKVEDGNAWVVFNSTIFAMSDQTS